jgi:hypothetical protein
MTAIGMGRILRGRDRMSDVLAQYLAPVCALERANNIAQALVLGADDPVGIAAEMLKDLGIHNMTSVANEVGHAWALGTANQSQGKSSRSARALRLRAELRRVAFADRGKATPS